MIQSEKFPHVWAEKELLSSVEEVLWAFPELKDAKITVQFGRCPHCYFSTVKLADLFKPASKRQYKIIIQQKKGKFDALLPPNVPKKAFEAILAHEFSHTLDFHGRNWFQLLSFAIGYKIIPAFKKKIEHNMDYTAIKRGFGEGLLAFRRLQADVLPPKLQKRVKKYYLSEEEIKNATDACWHKAHPVWAWLFLAWNRCEKMLSFALITSVATILDIAIFWVLYDVLKWHLVPSNAIAFFVEACFNFFVSRKITFADDKTKTASKLPKYMTVATLGLIFNTILLQIMIENWGWGSIFSKWLSGVCTFFWSFTVNSLWTFGKREKG